MAESPTTGRESTEPTKATADSATATELGGVTVNLVPDEVEIALRPTPSRPGTSLPCELWHRVTQKPGALVSLWSRDDKLRIVRLTVTSAAYGWSPRWVQWSFAVRHAPEAMGSEAATAQDRAEDDGRALILVLLPGEQRSATLELVPAPESAATGDYEFDVIVTDLESAASTTAPGLLRLRHPESTLLRFLPAIYAEAARDRREPFTPYEDPPFIGRFLRGFEDAMEPGRTLLDRVDTLFDSDSTPADFLPWLATWVALVLDENWPELKRRRLIREAVQLYRWRGTKKGLSRYLEIYTGIIPEIEDQPFEGMRLGANTLLGQNTTLGGVASHTFVVTLAMSDRRGINEQIVRDIIESEKPAHAGYAL
ncbi:MAG TPA: phage tail protein, partial [Capsulimonadaceae bacterium]|nr:phage tail protein [Capsulimonadaceae bacterium]